MKWKVAQLALDPAPPKRSLSSKLEPLLWNIKRLNNDVHTTYILLLTLVITRKELLYRSFLVTFANHCGNCTKAMSWLFSSSMKKQSASRTVSGSFEYISQSRLRTICPLLIFDDTLICTFIFVNVLVSLLGGTAHDKHVNEQAYTAYQSIHSPSFEIVEMLGSLFSSQVY
jgi:hypothetical protein